MYWLLEEEVKASIRSQIESLTTELSHITGTAGQADQLFPFVGRKDIRKAQCVIRLLSDKDDLVVDPFSGSGIFSYAACNEKREIRSNEWEPYTWRMSIAPWNLPSEDVIKDNLQRLLEKVKPDIDYLYSCTCDCGETIVIDSQFFDRIPLSYTNVTPHERLGRNGETITYRGKYRCKKCGKTEKMFTASDAQHLSDIEKIKLDAWAESIFSSELIVNSRINITSEFSVYGNLFPYRSQLALQYLWNGIHGSDLDDSAVEFFEEAFLSIIPQAKYKDYRSKSQDLHVPAVQLREVNLLNRFVDAVEKRSGGLREYHFSGDSEAAPISCCDFRAFLDDLDDKSVSLLFTDPPWTDGNAYFEKAQIYHPWIGYCLSEDSERMSKEFVVTDAPSRSSEHNEERWWDDLAQFFSMSVSKIKELGYLAIYFRPIPARRWLQNLNRLKFLARKAGFEPLLAIDAASKDPSMRIQQSASFVFAEDLVFVFLRLPEELRRHIIKDVDLDYLAFKAGSELQQELHSPFTELDWRKRFTSLGMENGVPEVALPEQSAMINVLFERYIREVSPGLFLVKPETPFNGQLFDVPAQERLFSVVPTIVRDLTEGGATFTYDTFLLNLSAYVENGTRMLIQEIQTLDIKRLIAPYATPLDGGKAFKRKDIPDLNKAVQKLMDLDPYEFENFTALLLKAMGYTDIALMGGSGDRGVDVIGTDTKGDRTVVQCKRYLNNVSADPIQRLHSFAVTRGAQKKIVITTAGFTPQAIDEAARTNTELIDGQKLEALVDQYMPEFIRR